MLSNIHAILLGLVEGVTEFLPISSTGHMILTANALNITQDSVLKSFEIFVQLGAICAVLVLFFKKMILNKKNFLLICYAFIPTAIIGYLFYDFVTKKLFSSQMVVLYALFFGGIALILIELYIKHKTKNIGEINEVGEIGIKHAILIGIFQSTALIPGVSRSAATIMGGLLLGISRVAIVEFSFMLAVPVMASAVFLDIYKTGTDVYLGHGSIFVLGFVTAFISAFLAVNFLLKYIKKHSFIAFGVYRIVFAILCFFIIL